MTDADLTPPQRRDLKTVLRKLGPWLIAAVVLYFVFQKVSITDVTRSVRHADLRIFLPLLLFNLLIIFLWESQVYTLLFRWFHVPVSYREMLPVRGASYMLAVLNFFAGQGGVALIMNRWKGLSLKRGGSIILFAAFNDYYLLLAFCLAGAFRLPGVDLVSFFESSREGSLVRFIVISWMLFGLHLSFYRLYLPRPRAQLRFKRQEIFSTFREAPVTLYFKLMAVRSVTFVAGILTCYFALTAFGLHVPLRYLAVFLPIVWLISSIPITVMGLGTTQAAMIWLVARFAEGSGGPEEITAAVLAYSLLWWFLFNLGRFSIGAFCLFRLPKHIWLSQRAESRPHDSGTV
ncbi:MAG: flippase-like domain-containing protein [Deltaproteobacteria bacterium]|nr:flippase-like domain-containing protein [Deltaproteobacteria bacterium]